MNKKRLWKDREIKLLMELYPNTCIGDIADAIGVSAATVRGKARELGLKRADDYSPSKYYGRYVKKGNHFSKKD